ncbi:hypothetical protein ASPFODRAFT_49878 [Aspergillus luchuensis CBS 106.47]|uniref:Uncharacterized protein n=1 Tax=Aspergillus luchuensis (strain CBS 106.47) TaxID=1137211 RepID=A0A1M3T971_ASPLC|nr:hypothetical protein ASPFODRAFT_49878 [Aspergillus luchuensis CBS 106.47]
MSRTTRRPTELYAINPSTIAEKMTEDAAKLFESKKGKVSGASIQPERFGKDAIPE